MLSKLSLNKRFRFYYGLFNDAFSGSYVSPKGWLMNDEYEWAWMEVVVDSFKVLSRRSTGGAEKNHDNPFTIVNVPANIWIRNPSSISQSKPNCSRRHTSPYYDAQDQGGCLIIVRRKGCLDDEFKDAVSKQIFVPLIDSIQFHNIDKVLNSNMLLCSHMPYSLVQLSTGCGVGV